MLCEFSTNVCISMLAIYYTGKAVLVACSLE